MNDTNNESLKNGEAKLVDEKQELEESSEDGIVEDENLTNITVSQQEDLLNSFKNITSTFKTIYLSKAKQVITWLPDMLKLNHKSHENRKLRSLDKDGFHPIRPVRGQIFNAFLGVNIGSELSENHLVVIIQNDRNNTKGEKVNVLPIEGDGSNIKNYHVKLTNNDLEFGHLDKDPSKLIVGDITTIDKARLGRRIGKLKPEKMQEIENKLRRHLNL